MIIKAPGNYSLNDGNPIVFLAGSIEMGVAEKWQDKITKELSKRISSLIVLNPRRDDWDSSWEQKKENKQFREQVEWELQGQQDASVIAMYFDPKTKSPITLLELGLFSDERLVVFCPDGFWRKGNVDVVCEWYNIEQVNSWDEFVNRVEKKLRKNRIAFLEEIWT
jgi:hypothetical protein